MNHKLNLKAADIFGRLLACVPDYSRDNFRDLLEKFLDAYDSDNAEKINADVKVPDDEDYAEETVQAFKEVLKQFKVEDPFAIPTVDKQRENSRLSELYKRFINNDNVNFFSARRRDDGSIEIHFEEIREV